MTDETRTVTRDQMRQALIESDLIPRYREYSLLSPSMNPAETVEHLAAVWGDAIFAALPPSAPPTLDVERLVRAMSASDGVNWPKRWDRENFAWVARQVAAEYARLGEER